LPVGVPYEVTIHTGDIAGAGTDSQIFMKVFGANGCTSDIVLEKQGERFERGRADLIKVSHEIVSDWLSHRHVSLCTFI